MAPQSQKTPSPFSPPLVSGLAAGVSSTVLLYPLELLRTRLQVTEPCHGRYTQSLWGTMKSVVKYEGWKGLYGGVGVGIVGSGVTWGGYFFFYERVKKLYAEAAYDKGASEFVEGHEKLTSMEYLGCAMGAGGIMVILTNPLWMVKTRLQIQVNPAGSGGGVVDKTDKFRNYTSPLNAVRTIFKQEGALAFYRGFVPAMMLTSHGGVQFATYEKLKHLFGYKEKFKRGDGRSSQLPSIWERMSESAGYLIMGGVSKIVASTTTYPLQVVKSRLQQRAKGFEVSPEDGKLRKFKREYRGFGDACSKILKREGWRGFYKGVWINSLRVAPNSAVTFCVYEACMDFLES